MNTITRNLVWAMAGLAIFLFSTLTIAEERPVVFVQLGHTAWVGSADMSSDGTKIVSGGFGGEIKIWDTLSGKEIRTLQGHTGNVVSLSFSPEGRWVSSLSIDKSCRLWEVQSGRQLQKIDTEFSFGKTGFSPDGEYFWAKDDKNIMIAETTTGRKLNTLTFPSTEAPQFSPSGKYALSIKNLFGFPEPSGPIELWDVREARMVKTFAKEKFYWAAISPDDRYVVSPKQDGNLELWELSTGKEARSLKWHPESQTEVVSTLVISQNGNTLFSATDSTAKLWDLLSGRELGSFHIPKDFKLKELARDGSRVLLENRLDFGNPIQRIANAKTGYGIKEFSQKQDGVLGASLSPDGKQVLTRGVGKLTLWDLDGNKEINTFQGRGSSVYSVAYAPNGKRMALVTGTGLAIWDMSLGKMERILKGHKGLSTSAAFSKDGSWIVSGGTDKTVRLWDLTTGIETRTFLGHTAEVISVAFSPDGRRAISGGNDATVRVWNLKTGQEEKILVGHKSSPRSASSLTGVTSVDISPNGKWAASGDNEGTIILWNLTTGKQVASLMGRSVKFSPDGKLLASIGPKGVRLWDIKTKKEWKTLSWEECGKSIAYVGFSKDARWLVTRSTVEDESTHLCDVKTGKAIRSFEGESTRLRPVYSIVNAALSPDSQRVLAADSAGVVVRLWDSRSGNEIARMSTFSDGDWIVITPEGYYNSSTRGDSHLNVRIGANIYGIENYRETFFRPDLVALAIAGGSLRDFGNIADVKQPPIVSIVNTPVSISTEELTLTIKIDEQGGGIGDVRLYLNGSAVVSDRSRGIKVVAKTDPPGNRRYTIKVSNGQNSIRAVVFNADNTMQSNEARHEVLATLRSVTSPSLHALVVGINEFKNPKLKLNYAVADASLFASTLQTSSSGLYQKANIDQLLTSQETSQEIIIQKLKGYQTLNPDDVFVFYVASHGTVDDGEYYLITSNVGSTRTEKLKTDAISQSTIKELIANIPATKKLIVLDTCNAGALGDAIQVAMLTRGMSEDTAIKILSRAMGSTVLSASTSMQEALEGYNQHGLFTFVLAEGMQGKADKGRTGYVKTTDLADYVDSEVPALAEKIFKRAQYPTISISGQGFPIGKATPNAH